MWTITKTFTLAVALLASAALPSPASGQQSIDLPSLGASEIFLRNSTSGRVVFQLQSEHSDWTEFALGPGESQKYSVDGDTWMNVSVNSDGGQHTYGLNMGERGAFQWVGNDLQLVTLER